MALASRIWLLSLLACPAAWSEPPARFFVLDSMVYRGAVPQQESEFQYLKELGVKTIISVDRARPNFAAARNLGMKYVHIPIGYGRVERGPILDFFKTLQTQPGPYYVHCHAGKFRAGVMTAFYRVALSKWPRAKAMEEMLAAFGDEEYKGLKYSLEVFEPPTQAELNSRVFDPDAPRAVPKLAEHMDDISHRVKEMEAFVKAQKGKDELPALSLAVEEHFQEITRLQQCPACDSADLEAMRKMFTAFQDMRLKEEFTMERMRILKQDCRTCHLKMRDLDGKPRTGVTGQTLPEKTRP